MWAVLLLPGLDNADDAAKLADLVIRRLHENHGTEKRIGLVISCSS
jgi:hypothetical protein